jgi:hypothetical protein
MIAARRHGRVTAVERRRKFARRPPLSHASKDDASGRPRDRWICA